MINVSNDGTHDFGYPCSMPEEVIIDGLFVDDSNIPENYQGMYFFTSPDDFHDGVEQASASEERPFPYTPCQQVRLRGLTTASGLRPRLSPNATMNAHTAVIEED